MKYTTASTFAFLFGALVVAACGGSEQPVAEDTANATGTKDAGNTGDEDPNATKQCVSSCTADSQCASSCPEKEGATQCCDLATSTCFQTKAAVCPQTDPDAGPNVPQY